MVIAFGYFLKKIEFISLSTINEMNRIVFSFGLPVLLFRNIFQSDFASLFDIRFILWILGSLVICFVLIWLFAEVYLRNRQELIGAFVQASFRSNYAILGIPLAANILGYQDTGQSSIAAAFIVTSYNVLSVIVLTVKNPATSSGTGINVALVKTVLLGVCKNPSIIGVSLGVILNLLNAPMPIILWEGINYIAILCTPLALIAVGGSIRFSELMQHLKPAIVASSIKIIVAPVAFVAASVALGFYGESLVVLFVMYANPTAILSYVMASRMNGNTSISSAIILITTSLSVITLTLGVYILRSLNLI